MGLVTELSGGAGRRLAAPLACGSVIAMAATLSGCHALAGPSAPAYVAESAYDPMGVVESSGRQPNSTTQAASPPTTPTTAAAPTAPPAPAMPAAPTTPTPTPTTPTTPVTPPTRDELARLLEDGETAYRARRIDASLAAFQRVVSIDPAQSAAWLRVGNQHQMRGDLFKALAAYRRVASRSGGEGADPGLRAKALYNLALVNLELAQQSLRTLERIGPAAAAAGSREPLSAAVQQARRRLAPFAGADEPGAHRGDPAPAPRTRHAARADAEPGLPRVDYIRGAPRP